MLLVGFVDVAIMFFPQMSKMCSVLNNLNKLGGIFSQHKDLPARTYRRFLLSR